MGTGNSLLNSTDAEYEAFQAAGGTQRLLQGGITPEQMVTNGKKLLAKANVVATPTVNDTTKKEGTYKDGVQVINGEVVEVKNGEIVILRKIYLMLLTLVLVQKI